MTEHPENNKEYTAQDFERYYSGKMSSQEMHQLEKAAMEDPFLADALEGYQYAPSPTEDRKYLQAELQLKTEKGKLVPIKKSGTNQFLRIAALFILLAGCGWAVYQFGFNKTSNDLAVAKEIKAVPPASVPAVDSTSKQADLSFSTANADSNKQVTTVYDNGNGAVSITTQNRHTGKLNNGRVAKQQAPKETSETATLKEIEVLDGNVASTSEASLRKIPGVIVDSTRYNYQQTVTPGKDNVIVMQRTNAAPIPEIVLSTKKKDSSYRKPNIIFEEAEPAEGNASYDDYVANNLQLPEEELKKSISGELRLSFDINDAGQAVNIQVEKSLCAECDKEAIRLLKEGPKLVKKKKNTKGKIRIRF
jgi:hypothetical protein